VDGVAPRAKLNQQRSRRFSASRESEILHLLKAKEEFSSDTIKVKTAQRILEKMDDNEKNNSYLHPNCITPGSEFLERCCEHITKFVEEKVRNNDDNWSNLKIIFSGASVPGEGEHKIMDFIRSEKNKPNYNPNTRHCLLGQDGDLIMLGLATHEPHFALFREKVDFSVFGQKTSVKEYLDNSSFELLHFSMLRDYLSYEFGTSDVDNSSGFDLERIIDDFVFMTFFVGNDFLPSLPGLNIAEGAFDLLFYIYKRHKSIWIKNKKIDPYLTYKGEISDGNRFEKFSEN